MPLAAPHSVTSLRACRASLLVASNRPLIERLHEKLDIPVDELAVGTAPEWWRQVKIVGEGAAHATVAKAWRRKLDERKRAQEQLASALKTLGLSHPASPPRLPEVRQPARLPVRIRSPERRASSPHRHSGRADWADDSRSEDRIGDSNGASSQSLLVRSRSSSNGGLLMREASSQTPPTHAEMALREQSPSRWSRSEGPHALL